MYNSLDYNNQNLEVIPQSKDKTIAINFENINDYYRKGYFVFYNVSNELSCALVKPSTISYIKRKYNNIIKFYSVTEKDLFSTLEQSFSQLITYKSQHYLGLLNQLCKFIHKYLKFYPQILSKNEPWLHSNFGWA